MSYHRRRYHLPLFVHDGLEATIHNFFSVALPDCVSVFVFLLATAILHLGRPLLFCLSPLQFQV
jgi:hypothetical protein